MNKLEFTATFGDKTEHVEISQPPGAAGNLQLTIDKYYHGHFIYVKGEWVAYLNEKSGIQGDDVAVLLEIARENFSPF